MSKWQKSELWEPSSPSPWISYHFRRNYIAVFAKNAIFQNFCNIIIFHRFAFFLFSPANFPQPYLDRSAPNLARMCVLNAIYIEASFSRKVQQPRHSGQKNIENWSIFHLNPHIFVRCDKTVEDFWKFFPAFTTRLLHLSENVFEPVQNFLV
jgi:hypothetical protein